MANQTPTPAATQAPPTQQPTNTQPKTAAAAPSPNPEPEGGLPDMIASTAKKRFFAPNQQLVEPGEGYNWIAEEWQNLYPFELMEPQDEALKAEVRDQWNGFKSEREAYLRDRRRQLNQVRRGRL